MISWLVLFDEENQSDEVKLLQNWSANYNLFLLGYGIKKNQSADIFNLISNHEINGIIFPISSSKNYLDESFKKDSEKIIRLNLPIICFNINRNLGLDENNCPRFLWSIGALHMPFTKDDTDFALKNIKINARETENTGSFFFRRNYPYDDPLSV